ncbi:hypothetical protein ACFLRI_00010 [Bacteroidota bacterium]
MGLFRLFIIFLTFWVIYRIIKIVFILLQIKYNQNKTKRGENKSMGQTKVKYVPENKSTLKNSNKNLEYTDYEEVE